MSFVAFHGVRKGAYNACDDRLCHIGRHRQAKKAGRNTLGNVQVSPPTIGEVGLVLHAGSIPEAEVHAASPEAVLNAVGFDAAATTEEYVAGTDVGCGQEPVCQPGLR